MGVAMQEGAGTARRGRDRVLVGALCAYFALVAMAAWPAPMRPAVLDGAHTAANRALQWVSVIPGQKVFAIPDRPSEMPIANCFFVRGFDQRGQPHDLWPPGGECMHRGVRFRADGMSIFLSRTLIRAGAILETPDAAVDHAHTFASIGRTFCGRSAEGAPEYHTVGLVWLRDVRSYANGTQYEEPVLAFSWVCAAERVGYAQWFPERSAIEPFFRKAK
jgi:hypothetical protein